jgi:hypothetical protein
VTDDELMARLREVDPAEFDPATRHYVRGLGRSVGCNVTCFEVVDSGEVLFIVHAAARPSAEAIRKAALPHVGGAK